MRNVAAEAGVSVTTVSHVLNGTRRVNQATAERVYAAIARTGYRPNSIARALAGARTQSLGLAISGISNPYFMDVIAAIEAATTAHGHTLLLGDTHDEGRRELQMVQEFVMRRVDGLLLAPSADAGRQALGYLASQVLPVVLLDRFLDAEIDQVGTVNQEPTALLVEHLLAHGHSRIAFIAGLPGLSTTEERVEGYRSALRRNDLPVEDSLIRYGGSQLEPARAATHSVLDGTRPPTAIIAGNNAMTIGALRALRERRIRVPDDLALAAFDDFAWSDLFEPRLTAIAQPTTDIGTQAVQLLLSRLDEPELAARTVRLPPRTIYRESCGCPAAE